LEKEQEKSVELDTKKNSMQKEKHILTIHFENEFVPL